MDQERPPTGHVVTRRHMLGLLGAAALGSAVGCGGSVGQGGESPGTGPEQNGGKARPSSVRVGLLVPQSGVYASLGADMKNGWELWLEQHGKVLGGLEVVTEVADEGETPDTGISSARSLLQKNVDLLVGIVTSPVALGTAGLMSEARKLMLLANAGANDLTGKARSPYVWRTSFTNSQVSLPLGRYMARRPGDKLSVFTVAADYQAGKEAVAGFTKGFQDEGGKVIGGAASPFGSTQDFQPYLSQIGQSGANAVYAFYGGSEAVGFVKQFAQFGLNKDVLLFGSGFLTEGGVLKAQGDAAVGVATSLHYSTEIDNPANRAFVDAYTAKHGSQPTVYAVQAWDAALVLDAALTRAGDPSGDALSRALAEAGEITDSPRGPWSFDNQNPRQRYYLREVKRQGDGLVNAIVEDLDVHAQPTL